MYLSLFVAKAYSQNQNGMISFWNNSFVKSDFSNFYQLANDNFHYFFVGLNHFPFWLVKLAIIAGFIIFLKKSEILFVQISVLIFVSLIFTSMLNFYPFSTRMIIFLIPIIIFYIAKIIDTKKAYIGGVIVSLLLIPHFIFAFNFIKSSDMNKGYLARELMFIMSKFITNRDTIVISEGSDTDYFYYNSFFRLKNNIESIKPDKTKKETTSMLLNNLQKGSYWLFISCDFNEKEYVNWAKTNADIQMEASSQQSTLMLVNIY